MRKLKEVGVRGSQSAAIRPMSASPKTYPIAVAYRRQTPEEQRQFEAVIEVFLGEMVRQHIVPRRGVS